MVYISRNTIELYTSKHQGITAIYGDFIKYNFDFIYSITTLQYIPFFKINKFFKKLNFVLNSNGRVFIQFPYSNSKMSVFENFQYTKYPISYIENISIKAGFEIIDSGLFKIGEVDNNSDGWAFILLKKN